MVFPPQRRKKDRPMPWTTADVDRHNKGLNDRQKRQWVAVANSVLSKCGGGSECEASAITQANGVVGRSQSRKELLGQRRIVLDTSILSRFKAEPKGERESSSRSSSGGGKGYSARAGETISGNLVRGSDGKFTSGNNPSSTDSVKPATRTAAAPRPRSTGSRTAGRTSSAKKPKSAGATAVQRQTLQLRAQREADRKADRAERLARQRAREAQRQQDRATRAAERIKKEEERKADRAKREAEREADKKRKAEAQAAKPPKGGSKPSGGGGGKGSASQRQAENRERASSEIERRGGLPKKLSKALQDLADGNEPDGPEMKELTSRGLAKRVGDSYELTPSGRGYLRSLGAGNVRNATRSLERARRTRTKAFEAPAESFAIFKDAGGQWRWLLISSNCYRDNDNEIVSFNALVKDCERADKDNKYGPLRWWHMGQPTPLDPDTPWGTGVDLGACDFNMVYGRFLVESGTFSSREIGEAIYRIQDQLQASIGFLHPPDEPVIEDGIGVFKTIYRFERSLVPKGLAANPFTKLVVRRNDNMRDKMKIDKLRQMAGDEIVNGLTHGLDLQEKALTMQNIAHKEAEAPPTYEQKVEAALLGFKTLLLDLAGGTPPEVTPEPAAEPAIEEKAAGDVAEEVEEDAEEEFVAEYVSDLTISDFAEVLKAAVMAGVSEAISPLVEATAMADKVGGAMAAMDELKALMGGFTRKKESESAQQQAEIEALKERTKAIETLQAELQSAKTQQAALETQLKELLGEQPNARPFVASQSDTNLVGNSSANYTGFKAPGVPTPGDAVADFLSSVIGPLAVNGQQ